MLVLTRKINVRITSGDNITVQVVEGRGDRVRLGITAPREIRVLRSELPVESKEA